MALASGDRRTAVDRLTTTLGDGVTETFTAPVDGWLLMARIRLEEGQAAVACQALKRALELAGVEGHRRPFVDAGPWLRPFLRAHPDILQATTGSALRSPGAGPPPATAPARPAGRHSSSSHSPSESARC